MTQKTQNDAKNAKNAKNAKSGLKNAKYAKFGLKNAKWRKLENAIQKYQFSSDISINFECISTILSLVMFFQFQVNEIN